MGADAEDAPVEVAESVDELIDWALERERDFAELEPGRGGSSARAPDGATGAMSLIMLREIR
jgi:hypothetical protein